MTEDHARKHDFKSSDLAFYVERLQILLYFIHLDLKGDWEPYDEACEHAQDLWDLLSTESYMAGRIPLTWFYGLRYAVPESHRRSFDSAVKDISRAIR